MTIIRRLTLKFTELNIVDVIPEGRDISTCEMQDIISVAAYCYDDLYKDAMVKPCYKHTSFDYGWLKIFQDALEAIENWTYKIDNRGVASLTLNPIVYVAADGTEYPLATSTVSATLRYHSGLDEFRFEADFNADHYCRTFTSEFLSEILLPPTEEEEPDEEEKPDDDPETPENPEDPEEPIVTPEVPEGGENGEEPGENTEDADPIPTE